MHSIHTITNKILIENVTDNLLIFLLHLIVVLPHFILGLCFLKVLLFISCKRKTWKTYHLVYFNQMHVKVSSCRKSRVQKTLQNYLSITILISLIAWMLFNSLFNQFQI